MFHFSPVNQAHDVEKLKKNNVQDLKLNECHVYASHNPAGQNYMFDEVTTLETVEQAIEKGCRYIKLLISDGPKGSPILTSTSTHKNLVTSSECFRLIELTAFQTNSQPFIISLELRCSEEQEKVLAREISSILSGRVYTTPSSSMSFKTIPSLRQLSQRTIPVIFLQREKDDPKQCSKSD
jgi:hypothetical protein